MRRFSRKKKINYDPWGIRTHDTQVKSLMLYQTELRGQSFLKKTKAYVMPKDRSIDIDDDLDFMIVEFLKMEQSHTVENILGKNNQ